MNKDLISGRQAASLIGMIIIGESLLGGGYAMAKTGDWIAMSITLVFSIIMVFIYSFFLRRFPNKSIYDIFITIFGKIFGRIFILIFMIYAAAIAVFTLGSSIVFIIRLTFMETPNYVIAIALVLFCYTLIRREVEIFSRVITVVFQILIVIGIIYLIMLLPHMNFINLTPIMASTFSEVIQGSYFDFFVIIGDVALLLCLRFNMKNDDNVHIKAFVSGILISGIFFIFILIANVATLGLPLASMLHFPTFHTFSIINIGEFITRIEVVLSMFLLTGSITKYCVGIIAVSKGFESIFTKSKYTDFLLPVAIFCMFLTMEAVGILYNIELVEDKYSWLKGIAQIGLPIIVAIASLFVKKKQKPKKGLLNIFKSSS